MISVEKVSLEDLVGSNFYCELECPPLQYLLDIEVGGGGEDAIMEDEVGIRGEESTSTKL